MHSEPNIIIGLLVFFAKLVEVKPGLKILLQNQNIDAKKDQFKNPDETEN